MGAEIIDNGLGKDTGENTSGQTIDLGTGKPIVFIPISDFSPEKTNTRGDYGLTHWTETQRYSRRVCSRLRGR